MGVVSQIQIKLLCTKSSKQAGGCLLIQESLCCMELKSTMPCAQEHSTRTYIKLNQVRGQLLHSLTIRIEQGPCFVWQVSSVTSGTLWSCVWADLWMDHVNTISQKTGRTKRYLWDKLRALYYMPISVFVYQISSLPFFRPTSYTPWHLLRQAWATLRSSTCLRQSRFLSHY